MRRPLSILAIMLANGGDEGKSFGLDDDSVTGQVQLQDKVSENMGEM